MQNRIVPALLVAVTGLAGCAVNSDTGKPVYLEAGSEVETTDFGNATMNNTLAQTNPGDYAVDLTRRFAGAVPNTVNFAFNSAVLDGQAQTALLRQADWIRQFPEVRFRVYGHTDLVGSSAYNQALGLRRAQAVVAFLTTQGISRTRLEAVASFGKTQPIVYTPGPDRRNRRTVTEVSGFVASNPLIMNGKYAQVVFREYVESAKPPHMQQAPQVVTGAGSGG